MQAEDPDLAPGDGVQAGGADDKAERDDDPKTAALPASEELDAFAAAAENGEGWVSA